MAKFNGKSTPRNLVVFSLLAAVFLTCVSTDERGVNDQEIAATRPPPVVLRPHTWLGGPLTPRPAPEEIAACEYAMETLAISYHLTNSELVPVTDPNILRNLAEAQALIALRHHVTEGWRWRDVQTIVAGIGTTYPVVHATGQALERNAIMGWDGQRHVLYVYPNWPPDEIDPINLAEIIVHEATHELVERSVLDGSAFDADELFRMQIACHDVAVMMSFVTESLAFTNEAAWAVSNPGGPSSYGPTMQTTMLAAASRRGLGDARRQFAEAMMAYAIDEARDQHRESVSDPRLQREVSCGPPPVLHGARRGEYFLPSDIAPTLIVPLLDNLE